MIPKADCVLKDHFKRRPELQVEWKIMQKSKKDPRVTRTGRWLRKLWLEELPQLRNVIRRKMSLVGTLLIVREELAEYSEKGVLHLKVKTGMIGLRQVSGWRETSHSERGYIDVRYIRYVHVWSDPDVLACTTLAAIVRNGAY